MSAPAVHLIVGESRLYIGDPKPLPQSPLVIYLVANDNANILAWTLEDQDLDDYDSITMHVYRDDGVRFSREAVIDDADLGTFHFEWSEGDLIKGQHQMEIELVKPTGRVTIPTKTPFLLSVRADIGEP